MLLERDHELGELTALALDAREGRGRLVLLEGPAGIGKTRLLEALRAHAQESGMLVLGARASELDREFPLGVLRQLFEPLLAGAERPRRDALLRGAAAPAASLLGWGAAGGDATGAGPEQDPSPLHFHALYWLTANLAEQAPVALTVDDAHWADGVSLRFLQFLLPRVEELPVIVAIAARPGEAGRVQHTLDAIATDPIARVVRPAPLTREAVAALVERELGTPDADLVEACRAATSGNPFLLRELLHALRSDGVRGRPGAAAEQVRQVAPPTVARAVLLRLARLGDEAVALARAIAVLGDGAPLRRAASLAGVGEERAHAVAAALAQADILAAARPLAFAHPILRASVYADIDPGERARAHRAAARLLRSDGAGAAETAVHLLGTEPAGDPQTVATLREAAACALARGAAATAVACLERARDEPPPPDERGPVLLELGSARLRADDAAGAAAAFDEGVRVTSDPRTRARHARERSVALLGVERRDEAFALLEDAVEDLAGVDADLALSLEASLIGIARFQRARLGWLRGRLERYRGRLTGATPGERVLLATQTHLDAFSRQSTQSAAALADAAERALAGGKLLEDAAGPSPPFCYAADVLLLADRVDAARDALRRGADDARRRGAAPWFWFVAGMRCGLLARAGDLPAAEADGRSAAELGLDQGWLFALPHMLGSLVGVLIDRGDLDDAEDLLKRDEATPRDAGEVLTRDRVLHAHARLRAARGDLAGAREALERLGPPRARWNTYPTLVPAVLVAPQLADEAERARVEQMQHEAATWGTPRAIGLAHHAAALLEEGDAAIERLEEAATVLARSPARLEHARALADLGAAQRRANRRAAAREPLRRALDLADACGARPLADRARHELRAAGGRPRRARISGTHALTASERRIAALAVEGLSNPEIAQALFVTTKTVEGHLSNAYRKLGIAGRPQLAAALGDGSATAPPPPA